MHYGIKEIEANELPQLQGIRLVDVRSEQEVAQGVIDGAIHIPLHLLPLRAHEFDNGKPVVFYCRSGVRSAQACAFMTQKGVDNVYNLRGGILAWASLGQPVARFS
jgi:rhodanese-related sulfurtransferase